MDSDAWRREVFARYADDQGGMTLPGFVAERLADVARYRPEPPGDEALLMFARFPRERADARIAEELERLRAHRWEAEWKVHDFDEPADLRARLEARGLRSHHVEALMVLDVQRAPLGHARGDDVVIERATGTALDEIAAFQEDIWQCSLPWLAPELHEIASRDSAMVLCAREGRRIVGSGWIEFAERSPFAQLHGGAVLEPCRGRGIYTRLYEARLAEAKRRGVPWIAVDAAPMSRPILEKKGFRFVCHTYPMRTRPHDAKAVTRA